MIRSPAPLLSNVQSTAPLGAPAARALGQGLRAFFVALAVVAGGCGGGVVDADDVGEGTATRSYELYQNLLASRRVEAFAPAGALQDQAERLLEHLERERIYSTQLHQPGEAGDPRAMRIVVGSAGDEHVRPLLAALGAEPIPGEPPGEPPGESMGESPGEPMEGEVDGEGLGFRVLGADYAHPADALVAVFEDPERDGLPVVLFVGRDPSVLVRVMGEIPLPWEPRLVIYERGDPAREVPLAVDGAPSEVAVADYAARRRDFWSDSVEKSVGELIVRGRSRDFNRQRLAAYGNKCLRVRSLVRSWFGGEAEPLELYLYDHAEDFERVLGRADTSWANPHTHTVHALLARGMPDDDGAAVARATAIELLGPPAEAWMLEALGVAAAGHWWERPLEEWVGRLVLGGEVPRNIDQLLDPLEEQRLSPHLLIPVRGFFLQFLLKKSGPEALREYWTGVRRVQPREWSKAFYRYLKGAGQLAGDAFKRLRSTTERSYRIEFRNGVALVDGHASYASSYVRRAVGASLDTARLAGADAVSLTVFSSDDAPEPALTSLQTDSVHGSAPDIAIASAVSEARARGMFVMLVVEPLSAPWGSWGDGIHMAGADKIEQFFEEFRRSAHHYALLSELLKVEILCLGSDLRTASRTRSDPTEADNLLRPQRREGWEELIAVIRGAYFGALTYAADLHVEADNVAFWQALDYIGLQLYPRLGSSDGEPTDRRLRELLREQFQAMERLSLKHGKPVLVCQTGFPARSDAWRLPSVPRGALDLEAQERFYRIFAEQVAVLRREKRFLRGLYLWNWRTDPQAGGPEDSGFTPQNKPAEAHLSTLFAR